MTYAEAGSDERFGSSFIVPEATRTSNAGASR